jgi:hypothetical protein
MAGQEHYEHHEQKNSWKNTKMFEARAGELEDASWIAEDRKCVTVCDSVVGRRSCRVSIGPGGENYDAVLDLQSEGLYTLERGERALSLAWY